MAGIFSSFNVFDGSISNYSIKDWDYLSNEPWFTIGFQFGREIDGWFKSLNWPKEGRRTDLVRSNKNLYMLESKIVYFNCKYHVSVISKDEIRNQWTILFPAKLLSLQEKDKYLYVILCYKMLTLYILHFETSRHFELECHLLNLFLFLINRTHGHEWCMCVCFW